MATAGRHSGPTQKKCRRYCKQKRTTGSQRHHCWRTRRAWNSPQRNQKHADHC